MKFEDFKFKAFIQKALKRIGFEEMTPVQEEVIPKALEGRDLIVQSHTGTGKSHSFILPILEKIDPSLDQVQAVITAPSRELASQLFQITRELVEGEDIRLGLFIGGTNKYEQISRLKDQGQAQLVIGTPGRIFDLMSDHALWVQTAKIFVVDEADMTFDLGFLNIVDEIASRMPKNLQIMAFSATFPQAVEQFLAKYMQAPERIDLRGQNLLSDKLSNYLIYCKGRDPKALTYELLTLGHPYLALVFTNTIQYTEEVSQFLKEQGLKVATLHGDLTSRERKRLMRQIRQLDFQYIVATDLAARGIDIEGISMVINTGLPNELEFFIHRVGRTGRNNLEGTAYTLVEPDDEEALGQLESQGIQFEVLDFKDGELQASSRRSRNDKANKADHQAEDSKIRGMIHQAKKKKVKPGYKKKLGQRIQVYKKREAKKNRKKG